MNNPPMSAARKISLIIITIVVVAVAAWLIADRYHANHSNAGQNQAAGSASPWAEYTSQQFGFKFKYLKAWGAPSVTAQTSAPKNTAAGAPTVTKFTGAQYAISFPDAPAANSITATLDSSDYSFQSCVSADQCATTSAYTQADVKRLLSASGTNSTLSILKKGANFYSALHYSGGTGVLNISQIVDLPKVKASAAAITYILPNAASSCKDNVLVTSGSAGCVTQAEYDNLSQFAGSFQQL